jgi:hypothetical protein
MVEETRYLLQRAINMGSPGMSPENNRAVTGLTEAEAAAVYACKEHYQVRLSTEPVINVLTAADG